MKPVAQTLNQWLNKQLFFGSREIHHSFTKGLTEGLNTLFYLWVCFIHKLWWQCIYINICTLQKHTKTDENKMKLQKCQHEFYLCIGHMYTCIHTYLLRKNCWPNSFLMNFSCSNILSLMHYTVLGSFQCKATQAMPSGDSIANKGCGSLPTLSNWLPFCSPNLPRCQLCFTSIADGQVDQIPLFKFMVASIVQASLVSASLSSTLAQNSWSTKHSHGMTDYDTLKYH